MELWYKLTLRTKWRFGYITPTVLPQTLRQTKNSIWRHRG